MRKINGAQSNKSKITSFGVLVGLVTLLTVQVSTLAQAQTATEANSTFKRATPLERTPPSYPEDASEEGIEGWVRFSYNINENGKVERGDVRLIGSSGVRSFEAEALIALRSWDYNPATLDGEPVSSGNLTIRLDFSFEEESQISLEPLREDFKERYDIMKQAVTDRNFIDARQYLLELEAVGLRGLEEHRLYHLLLADYASATSNRTLKFFALNGIFTQFTKSGEIGMFKTYAFKNMFSAARRVGDYQKAIDVFNKLKRSEFNNQLLQELQPERDRIIEHIANKEPIKFAGITKGNQYWFRELSYKTVNLVSLQGGIEESIIRCQRGEVEVEFARDRPIDIPSDWGKCSLLIQGDDNTYFTFVETAR
ncbi:energy transducer TonB [Glaciecola sp. MH2013]|uniref:energy transducer TonB n=1 Tax=Glaciecola sp. MH2013 TaxID=2785524 RepID=UPI00189DA06D|nr:energy transducer TonB [Glaciecola sp. MH2013]MBF7071827.1 energy transducer TonB [Glaciecola sp. MH2013]